MKAMIKKVGEVMDVALDGTPAELLELVKGLDLVPNKKSQPDPWPELAGEELKKKKIGTRVPTRKKAPTRKAGKR